MSSNRLSGLNVLLLVVAAASLMFGAYGLISNGDSPGRPANGTAALPLEGGLDTAERGGAPLDTTRETRREERRDRPEDAHAEDSPRRDPEVTAKPSDSLPEIEVRSDPSDSGDAVIQGTVMDSAGAPVPDARVTARRSNLEMDPPSFQDDDLGRYREEVSEFLAMVARETRATTTDAKGNFRFSGLDETLAYNLSASSEFAGSGELSRVAAGDTVVLLLSAESLLRGRVQTQSGEPVTDFEVRAWRQNRRWETTTRGFNSADGRFAMSARPGAMQVEITAKGYTKTDPIDVEAGGDEVLFVLDEAAVLTGIVADKAGTPLPGVTVRVGSGGDNNNWRGWGQQGGTSTRTDSKGRYQLDTLAPRETTFTATLGEKSESQTTTLVQGMNTLDFTIDAGALVKVRLSDPNGAPIEADSIWFQVAGSRRGWTRPERMPSREPGLAEYAGLNAGTYTMTVTASGFPAIQQEIEVKDGANEFTLKFSSGAMLQGTVTSSSGGKLSNIRALLRKEDDENRWGGWGTGRNVQVGEDGSYKLGPIEPGRWNLEVYNGNNWQEPVYSEIVTLVEGENTKPVVVNAGATAVVRVVDEQGNSVSWANVQLQGVRNYNQATNGEGVATISFVEVGSYTMLATSRGKASPSTFVTLRAGDNQLTVIVQEPNCCRLTHIYPDTQAAAAGLQVGDLVIEYNGEVITSWGGLGRAIRRTRNTDEVVMLVERGGSMLTVNLKGGTVGIEGTDGVR
jgi:protocatechuate 3,4-dioxygenase beta subunit